MSILKIRKVKDEKHGVPARDLIADGFYLGCATGTLIYFERNKPHVAMFAPSFKNLPVNLISVDALVDFYRPVKVDSMEITIRETE